jgi:hypothetical protein
MGKAVELALPFFNNGLTVNITELSLVGSAYPDDGSGLLVIGRGLFQCHLLVHHCPSRSFRL